nr:DUF4369 domain-containing protein [uncultured Prevotella sp.]
MKKIFAITVLGLLTVVSMVVMAGCQSPNKQLCRIHGKMELGRWDGKKIFLVPMFGLQDAAHVDSVVIKDGTFEFAVDTVEMKVIRVDYHYRDGVQDLLVVSEPGDVEVTIGANSITSGTPQNDSLQVWKDQMMKFNRDYAELRMRAKQAGSDQILMTEGKEVQKEFRKFNKEFSARMTPGVFKDFLKRMYPY